MELPHYQIPVADDYLPRVHALRPVIEQYGGNDEQQRRVSPEIVAAMKDAALFRLMQPWRLGGLEAPLSVSAQVVQALSRIDPSAGWVLMAAMGHAFMLGGFSTEAQDEVKHDDPDTILGGGAAPTARAVPIEGGYRVSGRCPFASGIDHSVWTIAGARVERDANAPDDAPEVISILVPPSDFAVHDDWFTLGLRATGSKTVVLDDVFVPQHRVTDQTLIFLGRNAEAFQHTTALYTMPAPMIMAIPPAANLLGIAERLVSEFVEMTRVRSDKYFGSSKAEAPGLQLRTAQSSLDLKAAGLLLADIMRRIDDYVFDVVRPTLEEKAEIRYALAYVVHQARAAAGRVYDAAGANATYDRSPLQKLFRDLNIGSHHATMDHDHCALQYGRVRLGLKPEVTI